MRYLSVCSGIEAATVAWEPLGFSPVGFAEIDPFCCAVLAHHFPGVKNHGDFTKLAECEPFDILVAGTPCQAFSVAGQRLGLDDPRGNLTLEFLRLAQRLRPRWIVWENVPGVLSIDGGRVFGTILGALAELGYGFAYRVLDAQFFGVPQRRRRVFVVGHLGDWRRAAAVLFEREGLCRDTPARRKAPARATRAAEVGPSGGRFTDVAPTLDARCKDGPVRNQIGLLAFGGGNTGGSIDVATACNAHGGGGRIDWESETFILTHVETLPTMQCGSGFRAGYAARSGDTKDNYIVPVTKRTIGFYPTGGGHGVSAVDNGVPTIKVGSGLEIPSAPAVLIDMSVRRLTPRECERLQGFPDDYTLIPNYRRKIKAHEVEEIAAYLSIPLEEARKLGATPDGPRYRAIGNSMAVPVMRWIGERLKQVEEI